MLKNVNITKDIIPVHWKKLWDFFCTFPQKSIFLLKWGKMGEFGGKYNIFAKIFPV